MTRCRETIVTMWYQGHSAEDIAEIIGISSTAIFKNLRLARALGDPRAARRVGRIPAMRRRRQILEMAQAAIAPAIIAKKLGVTKRIVQIRIKEAQNAHASFMA